jgi:hypothetical protein
METPELLTIVETAGFIGMVGMGIYKRILNWRKFNDRTTKLENSFEQYQKDQKLFLDTQSRAFELYLKTCETCRTEVRFHHESDVKHVTQDMRTQMNSMADSIKRIEAILMEQR